MNITSSLTVREEHTLRVFENRVLRRIFVSSQRKWQEVGENPIMRSFVIGTPQQIMFRATNQGR
jgi:hypothetical protein